MQTPLLSVIIPWSNRPELVETLRINQDIFKRHKHVEIIIVNGGANSELLLPALSPNIRIAELKIPVFNKSLCLNIGTFLAKSPHLFFLDADILLREDILLQAIEAIQDQAVVTYYKMVESDNNLNRNNKEFLEEMIYYMEIKGVNGNCAKIQTERLNFHEDSRVAPGIVFILKSDFLAVNGMNAGLKGWGWEDNDLLVRLQLGLGLGYKMMGTGIHCSHDDSARNLLGKSRSENEMLNFSTCLHQYRNGNYKGTYEEDVSTWKSGLLVVDTEKTELY